MWKLLPLLLKCGQRTRMPKKRPFIFTGNLEVPSRSAAAGSCPAGIFLEEGVEEEERAHYGAYLKKRIRPAVERLILEDDWEKIEKLYENEWFGEQELEVFLKLAEEWRRPAALMGLLHLKKANYGFKEKKFEL